MLGKKVVSVRYEALPVTGYFDQVFLVGVKPRMGSLDIPNAIAMKC